MPPKRFDQPGIGFLTATEIGALVAAPDRAKSTGRRDRTLLHVTTQNRVAGVGTDRAALPGRAPEFRPAHALPRQRPQEPRHPADHSKRCRAAQWLAERAGADIEPIVCTRSGHPSAVTPSSDWSPNTPPLPPHRRDETCFHAYDSAIRGHGSAARWCRPVGGRALLGHESTQTVETSLYADMAPKERALAHAKPEPSAPDRYHPPDDLLAFLNNL